MKHILRKLITFDGYYWLGLYFVYLSVVVLFDLFEYDRYLAKICLAPLMVLTAIQLFKRKHIVQYAYALALVILFIAVCSL